MNRELRKPYVLASYFLLLASFLGLLANEIYLPHTTHRGANSIEIRPGTGTKEIAEILKNEGVIRSSSAFLIYVKLKGAASKLQSGNYVFGKNSIPEIARALVVGGTNEIILLIPEGWTSRQIAERLDELGIISGEEFLTIVQERELEGYLFPDTYRIFTNSKPKDLVLKMLENFEKKITPKLREEIKNQQKTLREIITMASLIEKEVPHEEDRAVVSGILWKRLKIGMALQVDATITYIKNQSAGRISLEDTKIDSPYNTYKYPGLPQGPIANPGLSAIKAAIYPKESPYLYYLSAPDGQTIFSRTLEEHNEAKTKYLR